jgi:hypothetical protein
MAGMTRSALITPCIRSQAAREYGAGRRPRSRVSIRSLRAVRPRPEPVTAARSRRGHAPPAGRLAAYKEARSECRRMVEYAATLPDCTPSAGWADAVDSWAYRRVARATLLPSRPRSSLLSGDRPGLHRAARPPQRGERAAGGGPGGAADADADAGEASSAQRDGPERRRQAPSPRRCARGCRRDPRQGHG